MTNYEQAKKAYEQLVGTEVQKSKDAKAKHGSRHIDMEQVQKAKEENCGCEDLQRR